MGVGQDLLGVQRLEVRAGCLDLLLQRLELALDALALGLGRGLDRSLERLLVGVEAFLGALLRGLGVGLELLDLFLNLGQHALRHIARHQVALVDHRLLIAVEPDRHGPARLGADAGLDVLRRLLALGRQRVNGFLQLFLEARDLRVDLALQLLGLGLVLLAQLAALGVDVRPQANRALVLIHVEHGEHVLADFLVDVCDDVVREVEDLLEVARRHVEQQAHAARNALEVPDVAHRRGELDVAHALAAHLGAGHLDAALVADDALVAVALVLSTVAFPVPCRTEYALAEKTVALRAERAVVDGFRLRDLAVRPRHDRVGRCQRKLQRVKVLEFQQVLFLISYSAESSPSSSRSRLMPKSSGISGMSSSDKTIWRSSSLSISTPSASPSSSLTSTLNDSGMPASSVLSPLTIASYAFTRPTMSSDFTVRISWRTCAAP